MIFPLIPSATVGQVSSLHPVTTSRKTSTHKYAYSLCYIAICFLEKWARCSERPCSHRWCGGWGFIFSCLLPTPLIFSPCDTSLREISMPEIHLSHAQRPWMCSCQLTITFQVWAAYLPPKARWGHCSPTPEAPWPLGRDFIVQVSDSLVRMSCYDLQNILTHRRESEPTEGGRGECH